jgi:quercetin dioxygenase-like cupin family protein
MGEAMRVIRREEIITLRSVVVDGVEQNLGVLKQFDTHPGIADFIREHAVSMAWVRLEPGECLETHVHPIQSMIVVAEGRGRTKGDIEEGFSDGDIILIPPGCHHGFEGAGEHGFWALSVQFEHQGLYHDPQHALVAFDATNNDDGSPSLAGLLDRNRRYAEAHLGNPLVVLLRSGRLADPDRRRRFLDVVQVWSTHFQRALLARSAFTSNPVFVEPFRAHLSEEFGHDTDLAHDRGADCTAVWDPVLEAAASWFALRMLDADDVDKAVLVHLVLEGGAEVVATFGTAAFGETDETSYFEKHQEVDGKHRLMADALLVGLDERTYRRLLETQRRGWEMLELVSTRIAELTERTD